MLDEKESSYSDANYKLILNHICLFDYLFISS